MIHFILGGISSGKSAYAERFVQPFCPIVYIATAIQTDDQAFNQKITEHQKRRPPDWQLIEAGLNLANIIEKYRTHCVLIDCISLWLVHVLETQKPIEPFFDQLQNALAQHTGLIVIVSNEVGLGGMGYAPLMQQFQKHLGILNQRLAKQADRVDHIICGITNRLK